MPHLVKLHLTDIPGNFRFGQARRLLPYPFQHRRRRDPEQLRYEPVRTLAKRIQDHRKRPPDSRIRFRPSVPVNKVTATTLALVTLLSPYNAVLYNRTPLQCLQMTIRMLLFWQHLNHYLSISNILSKIVQLVSVSILEIEKQEKAIHYSLKQSAAQRKNILKAAFSGQLVPQDPNDEPASVLLERIRAERKASEKKPKKTRVSKVSETG